MGLSTAERNRRKRERKKKEREEQRKKQQEEKDAQEKKAKEETNDRAVDDDIEIEYVAEPLAAQDNEAFEAMRRFQERAAAIVTDDDEKNLGADGVALENKGSHDGDHEDDDEHHDGGDNDDDTPMSKRKLREMVRPSVAELKRRVQRPDLVEAHDVTAANPEFLVRMKGVSGTVSVPRHWGRKRKYLQGKVSF